MNNPIKHCCSNLLVSLLIFFNIFTPRLTFLALSLLSLSLSLSLSSHSLYIFVSLSFFLSIFTHSIFFSLLLSLPFFFLSLILFSLSLSLSLSLCLQWQKHTSLLQKSRRQQSSRMSQFISFYNHVFKLVVAFKAGHCTRGRGMGAGCWG